MMFGLENEKFWYALYAALLVVITKVVLVVGWFSKRHINRVDQQLEQHSTDINDMVESTAVQMTILNKLQQEVETIQKNYVTRYELTESINSVRDRIDQSTANICSRQEDMNRQLTTVTRLLNDATVKLFDKHLSSERKDR